MYLDIKTQAIQPENLDDSIYSVSHLFTKTDEELNKKRGQLFLVMYIKVDSGFDLKAATKLFIDHLSDTYYALNEYSPLKNLERSFKSGLSILESFRSIDDKTQLGDPKNNTVFSISLGLVWNRVFYAINYKDSANYIIRGSGARDLNSESLPSITTNSLILESEDVIILGTDIFKKHYPVKNIIENLSGISTRLNKSEDGEMMSIIIIKIEERLDKQQKKKRTSIPFRNNFFNFISTIKNVLKQDKKLSDEFEVFQSKQISPISSIAGITSDNENLVKTTYSSRPIRLSTNKKYYRISTIAGLILLSILITVGIYIYRYSQPTNITKNELIQDKNTMNQPDENDNTQKQEEEIKLIIADILLDPSTLDKDLDISSFGIFGKENILFYSGNRKETYSYNTKTKDRKTLNIKNQEINKIRCFTKYCILTGNELIFVLDPNSPDKIDKYSHGLNQEIIDVGTYGQSGYVLTKNDIFSFRIGDTDPIFKSWIVSSDKITNGYSMVMDSGIYLLDGNILKEYFGGKRQTFELKGNESNIDALLSLHNDSIYGFDSTNMKIIKISESSGVATQVMDLTGLGFSKSIFPQDVSIYTDNTTSKVYIKYDKILYTYDLPK